MAQTEHLPIYQASYDLEASGSRSSPARIGTGLARSYGSRLQSPAPALGHRHAESGRVRGALLGSPRSGLTQVSTRPGQDHCGFLEVEHRPPLLPLEPIDIVSTDPVHEYGHLYVDTLRRG